MNNQENIADIDTPNQIEETVANDTEMLDFNGFGFDDRILKALDETGHVTPTPIQAQAIPKLLNGKDLLAVAQTGTGKTAGFALPTLQLLTEKPIKVGPKEVRALILAPTRELVTQIEKNMRIYARHFKLKHTSVYGGTPYRPQIQAMRRGADILVATPGRLIDLLERDHITLDFLELFILDEADRMLDMGFIHDIRKIMDMTPEDRQSVLFSATMPRKVEELARTLLNDPEHIEITPESTPVDRIEQKLMYVDPREKLNLLLQIARDEDLQRAIIFTKTKYKADKVAGHLERAGILSESIHGDKSQAKRQRVLNAFQKGRIKILVATDVAARGIDVSDITHVFNYELPMEAESYIHRIGRTARAGTTGIAISFCSKEELHLLRDIEHIMKQDIPVYRDHPFHDESTEERKTSRKSGKKSGKKSGGGRQGSRFGNKSGGRGGDSRGDSRGGDRNRSGGGRGRDRDNRGRDNWDRDNRDNRNRDENGRNEGRFNNRDKGDLWGRKQDNHGEDKPRDNSRDNRRRDDRKPRRDGARSDDRRDQPKEQRRFGGRNDARPERSDGERRENRRDEGRNNRDDRGGKRYEGKRNSAPRDGGNEGLTRSRKPAVGRPENQDAKAETSGKKKKKERWTTTQKKDAAKARKDASKRNK